jgi:hypothetical protein
MEELLFFFFGWSGIESNSTEVQTLIVHASDDDDVCEAIGGMISRANQSTRRTPAPVSLCAPQIPHDLTRLNHDTVKQRDKFTFILPYLQAL